MEINGISENDLNLLYKELESYGLFDSYEDFIFSIDGMTDIDFYHSLSDFNNSNEYDKSYFVSSKGKEYRTSNNYSLIIGMENLAIMIPRSVPNLILDLYQLIDSCVEDLNDYEVNYEGIKQFK